ncbi:MAG: hypothetical protein D6784_05950 [Chloroflexi bacterium]|nr:MAG: hypothetical protein D6784_05950 [Chloroflexota bacterium]
MDRLEEQLKGKARVIRLDVFTGVGRAAARRYGVMGTPTLLLVNQNGELVLGQAGIPRPGPIVEQVDALLASQ